MSQYLNQTGPLYVAFAVPEARIRPYKKPQEIRDIAGAHPSPEEQALQERLDALKQRLVQILIPVPFLSAQDM